MSEHFKDKLKSIRFNKKQPTRVETRHNDDGSIQGTQTYYLNDRVDAEVFPQPIVVKAVPQTPGDPGETE